MQRSKTTLVSSGVKMINKKPKQLVLLLDFQHNSENKTSFVLLCTFVCMRYSAAKWALIPQEVNHWYKNKGQPSPMKHTRNHYNETNSQNEHEISLYDQSSIRISSCLQWSSISTIPSSQYGLPLSRWKRPLWIGLWQWKHVKHSTWNFWPMADTIVCS